MLAPIVIGLGSLGFLGFGIALLIEPQAVMASIGFVVPDGVPATEIRAFYGGAEIALGLLLAACLWRPERRRVGLQINAMVYGCIGLARVAGMLIDGSDSTFLRVALATELGLAGLSLLLLRFERRP
jgi:peptidoglycan/LPS O-acetylase OafA/YrhL